MNNCQRCGKSEAILSWGFLGICTECASLEKEREEDIEREEAREEAREEREEARDERDEARMEKLLEKISDGGSSSNYSSYSVPDTSPSPSAKKTSPYSDNSGLIIGAIAYIGVILVAWELMDHVARFSGVWWLCILALLAGIPLYIAVAYVAFWLGVAAIVILIIMELVKYFMRNPF